MAGFLNFTKDKQINKVIEIDVRLIVPNPHQPRTEFDDSDIRSLAESIGQNGILQPLSVRKSGEKYELIAGERRLRAAKMCGLQAVPCIVHDISERNSAILALVENIQRQDLSFFDEAAAIEKLISYYGMTQEDAASKLGKAQSTIANKLRLLRLTPEERELIMS
ncbi:MAG: ParB/RepB/Spo0J family partition protein, partial [Ruminococcus sp.]|nr:ParB/RepB/Spo0J family partition protein [Ruminococcus sp.]